jgi:hypothetical protein
MDDYHKIMFTRSTDGGQTFEPSKSFFKDKASSSAIHLSASDNDVSLLWIESSDAFGQVLSSTSHDGGETFDPITVLYKLRFG